MSNTGTAFSAANWEVDTLAYTKRIGELSLTRMQEIVARAEPFVKRAHRRLISLSGGDIDEGGSVIPDNQRLHIRF